MTHTGAASDLCARCGHERRYHGPHDLRRSHHVFGEKGNGGKPHPRAQVIGTNPWYCGENPMCTCLKFVEADDERGSGQFRDAGVLPVMAGDSVPGVRQREVAEEPVLPDVLDPAAASAPVSLVSRDVGQAVPPASAVADIDDRAALGQVQGLSGQPGSVGREDLW